jgi:NAD(P)-dependent dehydrogenase (short-subunit alcohol dehydrogenase family)
MLLQDKVIIVTGVGPGMGRQLALLAAAEGACVAVAARSADFISGIASEIRTSGGRVIAVPTDVGDAQACARLVAATLSAFGRIDGLVNSAYKVADSTPFETADIDAWQANMDVTCFGAVRMIQAVLPAMKAAGGGAIVNMGALAAAQPAAGQSDYAVSKAALEGATRQLARELGVHGIRVNVARMGWLWGEPVRNYLSWQAQQTGVALQSLVADIAARTALGVIPPEEECAKSALFLVSDYARMITGAILDVNGGEYMVP